jgi:DNA-binding GntR family transcriptional regulator
VRAYPPLFAAWRKALAVLRGEGLVKTVKGRGIYVTAPGERA